MIEGLELVHIVLGLVGTGLTIVGLGLKAYSTSLRQLDNRLLAMDARSEERWSEVSRKIESHEQKIHALHVSIENRVATLEAAWKYKVLEREGVA